MKKLLVLLVLGTFGVCAFGALQYEIVCTDDTSKFHPQKSDQFVSIKVLEGGSIWLTSKVTSYWSAKVLGDQFNMTEGNYGWQDSSGTVHASTGEIGTASFTNDAGKTIDHVAYYLGDFNTGDEIGLWFTTKGGLVGTSWDQVVDHNGLGSRMNNLTDLAGNSVLNFSFRDDPAGIGSVEFIISGGEYQHSAPSGQPLPGALAALLIGSGVALARKRSKAKKQ